MSLHECYFGSAALSTRGKQRQFRRLSVLTPWIWVWAERAEGRRDPPCLNCWSQKTTHWSGQHASSWGSCHWPFATCTHTQTQNPFLKIQFGKRIKISINFGLKLSPEWFFNMFTISICNTACAYMKPGSNFQLFSLYYDYVYFDYANLNSLSNEKLLNFGYHSSYC